MAVRQLKVMFAKLFYEYEFQWAGGPTKGPKTLSRTIVDGQIFPDLSTKIEIRKRASFDDDI